MDTFHPQNHLMKSFFFQKNRFTSALIYENSVFGFSCQHRSFNTSELARKGILRDFGSVRASSLSTQKSSPPNHERAGSFWGLRAPLGICHIIQYIVRMRSVHLLERTLGHDEIKDITIGSLAHQIYGNCKPGVQRTE
jgi:hypothetical protein